MNTPLGQTVFLNSTWFTVLLDDNVMVYRVVCCRQIDECCAGNHTSLVFIVDVLSQVKQLAGA